MNQQNAESGVAPDSDDLDPRQAFGRDLAVERARAGLSIEDAASQAGIAPKTWQRIESGKTVRAESIRALDRFFNLPSGTVLAAYIEERRLSTLVRPAKSIEPPDFHTDVRELPESSTSTAEEAEYDETYSVVNRILGRRRKESSDQDTLIMTVGLLAHYNNQPIIAKALASLVPVAFAGVVNDLEIFDEEGNFTFALAKGFSDRSLEMQKNKQKGG